MNPLKFLNNADVVWSCRGRQFESETSLNPAGELSVLRCSGEGNTCWIRAELFSEAAARRALSRFKSSRAAAAEGKIHKPS